MSNARRLADLLDSSGDVLSTNLDNVTTYSDATTSARGLMSAAAKTKLDGIEASATADQTGAEIKAAYEAEANAFTDTLKTKLDGIEASATADQTKADIEALGIAASSITGALPAISGANLTGIDALPAQTSHSGKYLTTDGSDASWAVLSSNSTTELLYEHANTLNSAYSISSGNNAVSAGPVAIGSSGSVTVPAGTEWVVI